MTTPPGCCANPVQSGTTPLSGIVANMLLQPGHVLSWCSQRLLHMMLDLHTCWSCCVSSDTSTPPPTLRLPLLRDTCIDARRALTLAGDTSNVRSWKAKGEQVTSLR